MKVFFGLDNAESVVTAINGALSGRRLGELVKLTASGNDLVLTISKLGTSTLTFSGKPKDKGMEFNLSSEKIAFTHKPMKEDFKEKISKAIAQAGGKILG